MIIDFNIYNKLEDVPNRTETTPVSRWIIGGFVDLRDADDIRAELFDTIVWLTKTRMEDGRKHMLNFDFTELQKRIKNLPSESILNKFISVGSPDKPYAVYFYEQPVLSNEYQRSGYAKAGVTNNIPGR
jgi:hypothetical protein